MFRFALIAACALVVTVVVIFAQALPPEDASQRVWRSCRWEVVSGSVTLGAAIAPRPIETDIALGRPLTILLDQCSGATWRLAERGGKPFWERVQRE